MFCLFVFSLNYFYYRFYLGSLWQRALTTFEEIHKGCAPSIYFNVIFNAVWYLWYMWYLQFPSMCFYSFFVYTIMYTRSCLIAMRFYKIHGYIGCKKSKHNYSSRSEVSFLHSLSWRWRKISINQNHISLSWFKALTDPIIPNLSFPEIK